MRADTERPVLAVDIGGSKILAALVSAGSAVIARERCLTEAVRGPRSVTERVLRTIETLLSSAGMASAGLESICVAAAGAVDVSRGVVSMSPSLPGWNEVPLRAEVEARFGTRTLLVNDASAAAVGEHRFGAGKGARNLVFITVSTGIGGGLIHVPLLNFLGIPIHIAAATSHLMIVITSFFGVLAFTAFKNIPRYIHYIHPIICDISNDLDQRHNLNLCRFLKKLL